jgi:hypothetical protein
LGFYPNALAASHTSSDRIHRVIAAAAGVLLSGLVVLVMRRLGAGIVLSGVTALAIAVNPRFIAATTCFTPHPWFLLAALVFLDRYEGFLETGRSRLLLLSVAVLAIAFATMELAPGLLLAAVPATFIARPEWLRLTLRPRTWWRNFLAALAVFFLALFLAWPGGILRGGYLVSYTVFAAQAIFQREEMFPALTLAGVYKRLFDSNVLPIAMSVAGILLLAALVWRRRAPGRASLWGLYALAAFGLNAGNGFGSSTYAAQVMVFLLLAVGLGIHYGIQSSPPRYQTIAALAGCALMGLCAAQELWHGPVWPAPADALESAVKGLPSLVPSGATVLVSRDSETYAAYLPQYRIEPTETVSTTRPRYPGWAKTPDYLLLDIGPLSTKAVDAVREHYIELARFKSARGASDLVLWRRQPAGG